MRPHPMNLMGSERNLQWRGPFKPRAKSWKADQTRNRNRNTTTNNNEPGRLLRRKMTWISGACQAYRPPRLQDLQFQNCWKASTHFSKRFNRAKTARSNCFHAPGAPLNTTSYLMCVKERGGIVCSVTPSHLPVTPALISPLPSPSFSSSYRGLVDEAKEEWGVNGYGSMSGLIRLRSPDIISGGGGGLEQGNCKGDDVAHFLSGGDDLAYFMSGSNDMAQCMIEGADIAHFVNEGADVDQCMRGCADVDGCMTGCEDMDQCVSRHDDKDGASERNNVDQCAESVQQLEQKLDQCAESVQQLEQKLDHDLSRFVMTYPLNSHQNDGINLMETRMEDQDSHIEHLQEENITLKGRLYVMQQEVGELRRRMLILEHAQFDGTKACSDEKSTADLSCT